MSCIEVRIVNRNNTGKRQCVEVQVCPCCLSPKVALQGALRGDVTGAVGVLPPKYGCLNCGWIGRLVITRSIEISSDESKELDH